jgi:hypothetical protein
MAEQARIIQVMQQLPERATFSERNAHRDADVREAMRLADAAARHSSKRFATNGWVAEDELEYAVEGRTLLARLRLTRPA